MDGRTSTLIHINVSLRLPDIAVIQTLMHTYVYQCTHVHNRSSFLSLRSSAIY